MSVSKRIYTSSFLCFASKNKNPVSEYIISVSTKVQKSAVKRNRIKRIIREALRQLLPTLPASIDCRIFVKKDCSGKKTQDVLKELEVLKTV